MSPPDTNLKEQEKRHRGPLLGMRSVVLFALALLVILTLVVVFRGNDPGNPEEGANPETGGPVVEESE